MNTLKMIRNENKHLIILKFGLTWSFISLADMEILIPPSHKITRTSMKGIILSFEYMNKEMTQ